MALDQFFRFLPPMNTVGRYYNLHADFARCRHGGGSLIRFIAHAFRCAGFRAVALYRLSCWLYSTKRFRRAALVQRLMHHSSHCWISASAQIGPGFLIAHVGGIVIGDNVRIGRNCDIRQNVTLGGNYNRRTPDGASQPTIGDDVSFGVGCAVLGPVQVGSGCIIGANSVVTRDVPEGMIVAGVPARVLKPRWPDSSGRAL